MCMKKLLFLYVMLAGALLSGVNAQTYLNISETTTVNLTQANINSQAYLAVTTENWQVDRTYCDDVTGTFYNMSSAGRILNIDVSNVLYFELYVQNSTVGRTYKVTVGSGTEQTITHGGANCEMVSLTTGTSGNVRVKLEGLGGSVYPVKIVLHPATASVPLVLKTAGDNPATLMATETLTPVEFTYYNVANDANVVAAWYTDDTYTTTTSTPAGLSFAANTTAKTVTLSGIPTVAGTYYYKVSINEAGGNAVTGVVEVTPYVVITPPTCRELRLESDFTSAVPSYTFASGDVLHGIDATGTPINLPNRNTSSLCANSVYRIQLTYVALEVKSAVVNKIVVHGTSSGTSTRSLTKLEVASALTGPYSEVTDLTKATTINTTTCGEITIEGLNIPVNTFARFTFSGNVNLSGMDLCAITDPGPSTVVNSPESKTKVFVNADNRIAVQSSGAERIRVYNLAGQQVAAQHATGQLTVVNQLLTAGVYIVKADQHIQKVIVK